MIKGFPRFLDIVQVKCRALILCKRLNRVLRAQGQLKFMHENNNIYI